MEILATNQCHKDVFAEWFNDRPKWVQTAAARLATSLRRPTGEEVQALADLCVSEANGTVAVFEKMPHGIFDSVSGSNSLRLRKLDKVTGVNAIRENSSLDFGAVDLSVLFGMNGSGKSGYARLLKHVCGARQKSDLLPNVFGTAEASPSCEVTVDIGSTQKTYEWKSEADGIAQLRSVHVFDSATAESYVDSKNLASYEPRKMRFLSALIQICDEVAAELANRKATLPKSLPAIPLEHTSTVAASFFSQLRYTTKLEAVNETCLWSAEDSESRQSIEVSLRQSDFTSQVKQLELEKGTLALFVESYRLLKLALSDERVSALLAARRDAETKRVASTDYAAKVFTGSALDGIGSISWRLMWDEARKYSEQTAYPAKKFPATEDGDLCVLCHQPLDVDAKERLAGFEAFVKSGLESSAVKAEKDYLAILSSLPVLPKREKWSLDIDFLKVDPSVGSALYDAISARLLAISDVQDLHLLPFVDWSSIDSAVSLRGAAQTKESATLAELMKDGKKAELEKTLKELKAREWISQQRQAIENEIARLGSVNRLVKAEALTKTNSLTTKKNELAKIELEAGYRERFIKELRALGGMRLKVEPIAIQEGKGKISFKIEITGARLKTSAGAVLSEGESRIVALAAFLADITGSGQPTPFVFDDPVSSLDQEFEERVVERLVELAKTRQVIVFTHRLSLLALVEDAIEARKRVVEPFPALSVLTLRSFGGSTGRLEEQDVRHKKPKSGFVTIRDHKLSKIRNHEKSGSASDYDVALKAACGDFRILTERCVEKVLLDGLMERFRRSIQTKQLKSLTKITLPDCVLIDSLMTKYSKFEHSQPDELLGTLPSSDELAQDLDEVIAWIEEFESRAI